MPISCSCCNNITGHKLVINGTYLYNTRKRSNCSEIDNNKAVLYFFNFIAKIVTFIDKRMECLCMMKIIH